MLTMGPSPETATWFNTKMRWSPWSPSRPDKVTLRHIDDPGASTARSTTREGVAIGWPPW